VTVVIGIAGWLDRLHTRLAVSLRPTVANTLWRLSAAGIRAHHLSAGSQLHAPSFCTATDQMVRDID
jgi:hypothetical protein